MGGINLNESGLDFVRQVFVTFGGNTTVLTLFLLSVLYLALKGKKEERYVFVTTAVFLAFTVYNPFAVKYILGKLGMVNVYYRFFWILPMLLHRKRMIRFLWQPTMKMKWMILRKVRNQKSMRARRDFSRPERLLTM